MGHLTAAGSLGRILFPLMGGPLYNPKSTGGVMLICVFAHALIIAAYSWLNRAAMLRAADVAAAVMQIVNAPVHACPVEISLEPQADPMKR